MTSEVPDKFPDFSGDTSGTDKKLLLGVGALGALGLAGLIYKLVSDKSRTSAESATEKPPEPETGEPHNQENGGTNEDL